MLANTAIVLWCFQHLFSCCACFACVRGCWSPPLGVGLTVREVGRLGGCGCWLVVDWQPAVCVAAFGAYTNPIQKPLTEHGESCKGALLFLFLFWHLSVQCCPALCCAVLCCAVRWGGVRCCGSCCGLACRGAHLQLGGVIRHA